MGTCWRIEFTVQLDSEIRRQLNENVSGKKVLIVYISRKCERDTDLAMGRSRRELRMLELEDSDVHEVIGSSDECPQILGLWLDYWVYGNAMR